MKACGMILAILALTLGATSVVAEPVKPEDDKPIPKKRQADLVKRFGDQGIDANGDGVLTRGEVQAFQKARKEAAKGRGNQANRLGGGQTRELGTPGRRGGGRRGMVGGIDRWLDRLEYLSKETPPADFDIRRFPRADGDGDGKLSNAEWSQFAGRAGVRLVERLLSSNPEIDSDKDGKISPTELKAFRKQREDARRKQILSENPEADTDEDGVLSDAEFKAFEAKAQEAERARVLRRNPKADTDGNGVLSDEELKAFKRSPLGRRQDRSGPRRGGRGDRRRTRGQGD